MASESLFIKFVHIHLKYTYLRTGYKVCSSVSGGSPSNGNKRGKSESKQEDILEFKQQ